MKSYCTATYRIFDEKADFQKKTEAIAVGLTVGSWTDLPEARKASMEKHLGKVAAITEVQGAERYADVKIAYPDLNFTRDIPALLVTVFGKLSMDGRIKLIDLEFSEGFKSAFSGPQFGIEGVRSLLGVYDRPLLMSIFKSCIGYDLPALKEQFKLQALGGVDLIKDDEILFENDLSPFEKRIESCLEAAEEARQMTGQKVLYAANLTGPTFELRDRARRAVSLGANCLLFNVLAYGYDVLQALASDPEINVPIMAHPSLAGAIYPSPYHGISSSLLLGKLMRLAGADIVLFPSPYGSVTMPLTENMAIKDALLDPVTRLKPAFPVPSAGIHPGLVPFIIADFGFDVIVNAGGGVHGHPQGSTAGGKAFRQAIDAVILQQPLSEAAQSNDELREAIKRWGIASR
jgi:2,3-diketo-5-methylthiopentyl-1-phosphate enolase